MTDSNLSSAETPQASDFNTNDPWGVYWAGNQNSPAFQDGGANHPFLARFWQDFFQSANQQYQTASIIDVACGVGAVRSAAEGILDTSTAKFTCLDQSAAAIEALKKQFPDVETIVSDISKIETDQVNFDIVTSQFGVEYGGKEALRKISKLCGNEGRIALILHHNQSVIHAECLANFSAISTLQTLNLIQLTRDMIDSGYRMLASIAENSADIAQKKDNFMLSSRALMPSFKALESIMDEHGVSVAGDTICTLYNKISEIQAKLNQYHENDLISWLENIDSALPPYLARMKSMTSAALSPEEFKAFCENLMSDGFVLEQAYAIQIQTNDQPLAWAVVAHKK